MKFQRFILASALICLLFAAGSNAQNNETNTTETQAVLNTSQVVVEKNTSEVAKGIEVVPALEKNETQNATKPEDQQARNETIDEVKERKRREREERDAQRETEKKQKEEEKEKKRQERQERDVKREAEKKQREEEKEKNRQERQERDAKREAEKKQREEEKEKKRQERQERDAKREAEKKQREEEKKKRQEERKLRFGQHQQIQQNNEWENLTFGNQTNYTGVFYKACNGTEQLNYTLANRNISLCPTNIYQNKTSAFLLAVASAFASTNKQCSNSSVCTPQALINEINKTENLNENILKLRKCKYIFKKYGKFNVSHNGNLFKNYFAIITLARNVTVQKKNKSVEKQVNIPYLVKEFKEDNSAVLSNPFGDDIVVKADSEEIKGFQGFRWAKNAPLPGIFAEAPRRIL